MPTSSERMKRVLSYTSGPTKIKTNPFSLNPFAVYPLSAGENQMEEGTTKTVWWVLLEMKTVSFVVLRNMMS